MAVLKIPSPFSVCKNCVRPNLPRIIGLYIREEIVRGLNKLKTNYMMIFSLTSPSFFFFLSLASFNLTEWTLKSCWWHQPVPNSLPIVSSKCEDFLQNACKHSIELLIYFLLFLTWKPNYKFLVKGHYTIHRSIWIFLVFCIMSFMFFWNYQQRKEPKMQWFISQTSLFCPHMCITMKWLTKDFEYKYKYSNFM